MSDQLQLHIEDAESVRPLWDAALRLAGERLGQHAMEAWLLDARPVSFRNGVLTIGAPNGMARDWIDQKYSRILADSVRESSGREVAVSVIVSEGARGRGGESLGAKEPIS